jgi:hypothetical protein
MSSYPANLMLLAQNVLDGATLTSLPSTTSLDRLADRDRGLQWSGTSAVAHTITVTGAAATTVSALAFVNHTITVSVQIAGSNTGTFGAPFATATPDMDPWVLIFATQTFLNYEVRITTPSVTPKIGELVLGPARVITLPPSLASSGVARVANTALDRSPYGYAWGVKNGPARARLPYAWTGIGGADLAQLQAAYTDCDNGAKPLIVRDPLGVARFMHWTSGTLAPVPLSGPLAGDLYSVPDATFEEQPA